MNKQNTILAGLFVMLAIAFILSSGCTGQNQNSTSPIQETSGVIDTINIGYQPSTHELPFMIAFSKGWYQEALKPYGIKTVREYQFATGAPEMQAMLSGDIDFAYVGAAPFVTAVSNGLKGKIVATVQTQGSDLVVKNGITYNSPDDLKGLTIATFPPGTIQDTLLRDWLSNNGINPDTDVIIKAMGPGDATTAIIAGQVDAVFLPTPAATVIENAGAGDVILQSGEMSPDHACCVLVASEEMIQNHPDIVREIITIDDKTDDYVLENPLEAATIMSTMTGMNVTDIENSMQKWDGHFVSNPHIISESVTSFAAKQLELGYLTNPVTTDDLFDFSFWDTK